MSKDKKTTITPEMDQQPQNDPVVLEEEVPANDTQKGNSAPPNVEQLRERRWLRYVITASVFAVMTLLIAWVRGAFTVVDSQTLIDYGVTELQYRMQQWSDSFSIVGILGICFGLLVMVSNGGAFDMLAYGMRRFFALFRKDPLDRKYGGYYEYTQAKRAKKRSFWYLVIVGGGYLLVGVIFLILYYKL